MSSLSAIEHRDSITMNMAQAAFVEEVCSLEAVLSCGYLHKNTSLSEDKKASVGGFYFRFFSANL